MRSEVLVLALIVGACTWAFRYLPTRMDLTSLPERGWLARFLASTGTAAIATLFAASVFPMLGGNPTRLLPMGFGIAAVLLIFAKTRSVVGATLGGSAAFGIAVAILGP